MSSRQSRLFVALLFCGGLFVCTSPAQALPEKEIRLLLNRAAELEKLDPPQWEEAREIYEALLSQKDYGLNIRERYYHAQRRCWQVRRHQDPSYRREVLSIEYGQAVRMCRIIHTTLLDYSTDKKGVDPTKLFHKGIEELDAALADPQFVREFVPAGKQVHVATFRPNLKKTWGGLTNMSPKEVAKQINLVAMAAVADLDLSETVVTMEFGCGACYAIDEYTVYLTPNRLRELARNLSRSEAIGVGLMLAIRENRIVVNDIAMGSPAMQSGINVDDQIISVNKKAAADLTLMAVKELLEGPVGSMVDVEVLTPGDNSTRMIRMSRQRAQVPSVEAFVWQETQYGYLKINGFTDTTVQDVDDAIAKLSKAGMKGLILDLRDNGGGLFESAIDTAQRFLATGIITSQQHKDPGKNFVYQAKNPKALAIPMVVLLNGDTASAAELLAGALKDNNRAYLIGQTTYGKGCTQTLLALPKATGNVPTGGMRVTVARFFSPNGVAYSGRGVTPHFIIEDPAVPSQATMMGQAFVDKAIQELNRMTMPK